MSTESTGRSAGVAPTRAVVPVDHVDLLVSAAVRYRLLAGSTTAAFATAPAPVTDLTGTGRLLLEENVAAARRHQGRGHDDPGAGVDPAGYRYRVVESFEPVEVIKAGHCYQHLTAELPTSAEATPARRLVAAIIRAATERLPGYDAAAWYWTRPRRRDGAPIGLRHSWAPVRRGVNWMTPDELAGHWEDAALVLVTVDALDDVPAGLPSRGGVYVCAGPGGIPRDAWRAMERVGADLVVAIPAGHDWLVDQLADPAAAVQRSRLDPAALTYLPR
jgi:hypothetical protein